MDAEQLRKMMLDVIRSSLTIKQTIDHGMISTTIRTAVLFDSEEICFDSVDIPSNNSGYTC